MLQVYTGNGKGKTTAAVGLAIRALGAGQKVYFAQFMKDLAYSEQKILQSLEGMSLHVFGKPYFIAFTGMLTGEQEKAWGSQLKVFPPGQPPDDYCGLVRQGLAQAEAAIVSRAYSLVVLDEINTAIHFGLAIKGEVLNLLTQAAGTEIVCTGRGAPDWLLARADLVTDMREVKHYYRQGIAARRGIEN